MPFWLVRATTAAKAIVCLRRSGADCSVTARLRRSGSRAVPGRAHGRSARRAGPPGEHGRALRRDVPAFAAAFGEAEVGQGAGGADVDERRGPVGLLARQVLQGAQLRVGEVVGHARAYTLGRSAGGIIAPQRGATTFSTRPSTAMAMNIHMAMENPTAARRPRMRLDRLAGRGSLSPWGGSITPPFTPPRPGR